MLRPIIHPAFLPHEASELPRPTRSRAHVKKYALGGMEGG